MNILVVGADSKYAIEKPYIKYLSALHNRNGVFFFRAQNLFLEFYHKSLFHKVLYRFGWSTILKKINDSLILTINEIKPDVILVFKGMEVLPVTLQWIKNKKIKLVNYNPDNPFIFSGRGSGNANVRKSINLFDLYLTYDHTVKAELDSKYRMQTGILPFGFDIADELQKECEKQEEVIAVCFLGNPDKHRAYFLNQLANKGIIIHVYGNDWAVFVKSSNLIAHPPVYDNDFWRTLFRYRIQLNIMRPHNLTSHNMRTFEIPGVGGIQLAPDTDDHRSFFESDKSIYLYKNEEDCLKKIHFLLGISTSEANKIRREARDQSLTRGYHYADRAGQLYHYFEKILHG